MSASVYDIVIVGAGSAGLTAAAFARQLGAKVALIERERIGGDCTWTGCVPSKALIRAARTAHEVRVSGVFGIEAKAPFTNMRKVRDYIQRAVGSVYRFEEPDVLQKAGIDVISGSARFVSGHAVDKNGRNVEGKYFLIAAGAHPRIPDVRGLSVVPYITYKQVFDLERLPESLIVLGSGPIGMEIAQAFQRLGTMVTMVGKVLLPRDEPEVRRVMQGVLLREGVRLVSYDATSVERIGSRIVVRTSEESAEGDLLLVATGRRPSIENMGLGKAGVEFSELGVPVDEQLRTKVRTSSTFMRLGMLLAAHSSLTTRAGRDSKLFGTPYWWVTAKA